MLPIHMREATRRYIEQGILPGSFLRAVITNDLAGAFRTADDINLPLISIWVKFFYNEAPVTCYGSPAAMTRWHELGGLYGKARA